MNQFNNSMSKSEYNISARLGNGVAVKLSATSIVGRARLAKGLPLEYFEHKEPVSFSLSFAKATNVSDAIIHFHLQTVTGDKSRAISGGLRQWIVNHGLGQIMFEVPCFNSRSTVQSSLERMAEDRKIGVGKTGDLLRYEDSSSMDKVSCYCVLDTKLPTDLITFEAEDAREHGFLRALIINRFDQLPADKDGWRKLSATELAKELPFKRVAIQNDITEMLGNGMLERHPDKPKLYRIGTDEPKTNETVPIVYESYSLI